MLLSILPWLPALHKQVAVATGYAALPLGGPRGVSAGRLAFLS